MDQLILNKSSICSSVRKWTISILTGGILTSITYAQSVLSLNFVGRGPADSDDLRVEMGISATQAAGFNGNDFWNDLEDRNGSIIAVFADNGEEAEVSYSAPGHWGLASTTAGQANGDSSLMNGHIQSKSGQAPATITVAGLGDDTAFQNGYDIYVYVGTHVPGRATIDLNSGASSQSFDVASWTGNSAIFDLIEGTDETGNYLVFQNVFGDSFTLSLTGESGEPGINGIEIITATPDDSDGDGLPDVWEDANNLDSDDDGTIDPNNGASGDPDNDGSPNIEEFTRATNPRDEDDDDDGLLDGAEDNGGVFVSPMMTGTDPKDNDTDDDGLLDGVENNGGVFVDNTQTGTDPNLADTDEDELPDKYEIDNQLDPSDDGGSNPDNGGDGDPDGDGLENIDEFDLGTSPQDDDTDDDDLKDGVETNTGEFVDFLDTGTDPLLADTDGDLLNDGVENNSGIFVSATETGTDPNNPDTDEDALSDGWEIQNGENPHDSSTTVLTMNAIGINFGANRTDGSIGSSVSAGVFAHSEWNNLGGANGNVVALNDDTGTQTAATITWDANEEWSASETPSEGNGNLLTGWIATFGNSTINITSIPYSTYDLIFYYNHDRSLEDVGISEANDAFPEFVAREADIDTFGGSVLRQQEVSAADSSTETGTFVIFRGVTASTLNITLNAAGAEGIGTGDRGAISGIQLIQRADAPVPDVIRITDITSNQNNQEVTIAWESSAGQNYIILAGATIPLALTDQIGTVMSSGSATTFTEMNIDFSVNPKRFYQVTEAP